MTPKVSVIIATYNRAPVLKCAIESVLESTIQNWELIVVGDHCTDETEEVVSSFSDRRIRFFNLPENFGEQSGPHNKGLELARTPLIAFLNHDDLYFPDHLDTATRYIEEKCLDLLWTAFAVPTLADTVSQTKWTIGGVPRTADYDPLVFVFSSAWVFRTSLIKRVGAWRRARETFVTPSQDWLFRAWRSGCRMGFFPRVGVLAVPGGARPRCYRDATNPEQAVYVRAMREDPAFRQNVLEQAAVETERSRLAAQYRLNWKGAVRWAVDPARMLLAKAGIHPLSPQLALWTRRKGGQVDKIRRIQGLPNLPKNPY